MYIYIYIYTQSIYIIYTDVHFATVVLLNIPDVSIESLDKS